MDFRKNRILAATVGLATAAVLAVGGYAVAADSTAPNYEQQLGAIGAQIDSQIGSLESQITALQNERDSLQTQNADYATQVSGLTAQIVDLNAQIDALKAQIPSPSPSPSNTPSPSASPSPSPSASPTTTSDTPVTLKVGSTVSTFAGETKQDAYDRRTTDFGAQPEAVRVFYPGSPSWINLGSAIEIISFKYKPQDVINGVYDADLNEFFSSTPQNGEVHPWVYWHEPEDDIAAGSFTSAQFKSATQHIADIEAQYDNNKTKLMQGIILMGWTVQSQSGRNITNYLPTQKVEWLGWDIYPWYITDIQNTFSLAANASIANGYNRYWITEAGLNSQQGAITAQRHADFILQATQTAADLGFKYFTYFDATVGGDWLIDTAVEKDAMHTAIIRDLPLGTP